MKLLRLSLLSSYFNYLSKNKKKALNFINLGIFLCIFAISTAGISFYIESKISEKQTQLLYLQIEDKNYSRFLSEFQSSMDNYSTLLVFEDNYKVEKEYLAQSNLESQVLTDLDFFGPYIFANLISSKDMFDDPEFIVRQSVANPVATTEVIVIQRVPPDYLTFHSVQEEVDTGHLHTTGVDVDPKRGVGVDLGGVPCGDQQPPTPTGRV